MSVTVYYLTVAGAHRVFKEVVKVIRLGILLSSILLLPTLIVGCGISEQEYYALVAERDSLKRQLESTQNELGVIKSELTSVQAELAKTKSELESLSSQVPSPAPAPAPAPISTKVVTIDIGWPVAENWDADPDIDGIELYLRPEDAQGKMVETASVVSAKLWLERSIIEGGGKGSLIQEWSGIQLTKEDYDWLYGATIHLEYKGFRPASIQFGILEVTFVTPDGKSFGARANYIVLGE